MGPVRRQGDSARSLCVAPSLQRGETDSSSPRDISFLDRRPERPPGIEPDSRAVVADALERSAPAGELLESPNVGHCHAVRGRDRIGKGWRLQVATLAAAMSGEAAGNTYQSLGCFVPVLQ
ncbi:hypothetical protein [Natrinema gari]|uniref:hypothetical protein n=1 Tax=Natrinema gari TaxID=419186 RepID=UPI000677A0E5|nr:hypothetical protein [Natrinema gari]